MKPESLHEVVQRVRELATSHRGQSLNEQDTKNAIIEPVLATLGWPKYDLQRVRAEYRHESQDNPVDYALMVDCKPVMFVEAKALDKDIREYRFVRQTLSYAHSAGVDWAMITNGFHWDLYCTFARTQASGKRFFSTRLDDPEFNAWMNRLTPENLEGNDLEAYWRRTVAARAVCEAASAMFRNRDNALVRLLAQSTDLGEAQVATALATLRTEFEAPGIRILVEHLSQEGRSPSAPSNAVTEPESAMTPTSEPTDGPRPGRLPRPPRGAKPRLLTIDGSTYQVSTWRELLMTTIRHVHRADPVRWPDVFESPEFKGQKRRYLARNADGMTSALEVPGGFVEGNLSARGIVRLIERLVGHGGIPVDDVRYEASATPD